MGTRRPAGGGNDAGHPHRHRVAPDFQARSLPLRYPGGYGGWTIPAAHGSMACGRIHSAVQGARPSRPLRGRRAGRRPQPVPGRSGIARPDAPARTSTSRVRTHVVPDAPAVLDRHAGGRGHRPAGRAVRGRRGTRHRGRRRCRESSPPSSRVSGIPAARPSKNLLGELVASTGTFANAVIEASQLDAIAPTSRRGMPPPKTTFSRPSSATRLSSAERMPPSPRIEDRDPSFPAGLQVGGRSDEIVEPVGSSHRAGVHQDERVGQRPIAQGAIGSGGRTRRARYRRRSE